MPKCNSCGRFITLADGAKCPCRRSPADSATAAAKAAVLAAATAPPVLGVPSASSHALPKGNPPVIASMNTSDITQEVGLQQEVRIYRAEMRAEIDALRGIMNINNQKLSEDLGKVLSAINSFSQRLEKIESRIETVEKDVLQQSNQFSELEKRVLTLELELNDRDQAALINDVEISGIPELPGESVSHLVTVAASKLGMVLDKGDIVSASRVGMPRRTIDGGGGGGVRPRNIAVRLATRALRDDMLRNARVRRGATTADIGLPPTLPDRPFYVNERLTKMNRILFAKTREIGKKNGFKYFWTKEGRILVRKQENATAHTIRTEYDLDRVFGKIDV